jgi:hypothetical protein
MVGREVLAVIVYETFPNFRFAEGLMSEGKRERFALLQLRLLITPQTLKCQSSWHLKYEFWADFRPNNYQVLLWHPLHTRWFGAAYGYICARCSPSLGFATPFASDFCSTTL